MSVNPTAITVLTASRYEFADLLEDASADRYLEAFPDANLRSLSYAGAYYIVDERPGYDRTVVVLAPPAESIAARDQSYQRGYPLAQSLFGRPADRGHFIAHSAGGLFGPNLFAQDRALNRGWSKDGRAYRAMENAAIAAGPQALLFVRPIYMDDDAPALIELGFWDKGQVQSSVFRNRFDSIALEGADRFETALSGATNAEAAALGEETARVLIETEWDGLLLDSDDAAGEREGYRHGLDLLMLVGGAVVAFEVKTRHVSRDAGRITRAGNLRRPRLRTSHHGGFRQGSDEYVAPRANLVIDAGGPSGYPESRVITVDFVSMLAQVFAVTPAGRVGLPVAPPMPCTAAAREAFDHIMRVRGSLAPPLEA
jgi:hypothetical protein